MHAKAFLAALAIAAAAPSPANAQQQAAIALDRLVPVERQKLLGLDQLTLDQRAGIVRLLQEAYQAGIQKGQESSSTSRAPSRATPAVIETQVDGEFSGWEGETIVKLMNGQIWQQAEYHYHYYYAYMPKVLVYGSGGGYKMKVDGVDKAIGVQRLK